MILLLASPALAGPLEDAHRDSTVWAAVADSHPLKYTIESTDCNGFALRYRERLLRSGVASDEMAVMNVPGRFGGRHAVLLVRNHAELWVLDNQWDRPYRWTRPDGKFFPMAIAPIPAWAPAWWR